MNNKGFTLVELVATISLLTIISIIAFVSINSVLNNKKHQQCIVLGNTIKMAVKEYISDNRYKDGFNVEFLDINVLIDNEYLKGDLVNSYTDKVLELSKFSLIVNLKDDKTFDSVVVKYNDEDFSLACGE